MVRDSAQARHIARAVLLLCLMLLAAADSALAHTRSLSYSRWRIDGDRISVTAQISRLELSRLGPGADPTNAAGRTFIGDYLAGSLVLTAGGVPCTIAGPPAPRRSREGWVVFAWGLTCPSAGALEITSFIMLDVAPSHMHFARIHREGASVGSQERVLSRKQPSWSLAGPDAGDSSETSPRGSTIGEYLVLGVEHILSGWDHLAFVLALLLLAGSLREVARLVTGFTIAHSVTLALAVLGLLHPNPYAVEAVIGFSVALVAAENSWLLAGRDKRIPAGLGLGLFVLWVLALFGLLSLSALSLFGLALFSICHFGLLGRVEHAGTIRTALAFCFGLVHGFGFAGVLDEMSLPAERLAPALFGFNVGVELGQLGVVLVAWPVLHWIERASRDRWHRWICVWGSAAICGIGVYWFVLRSF